MLETADERRERELAERYPAEYERWKASDRVVSFAQWLMRPGRALGDGPAVASRTMERGR